MADYWKSTPKYWCKFCTTFVRDTKFERQQHEATGRHQGAIQRSLRTINRDKEREDRDKQRARDEVARLNGLVGGGGGAGNTGSAGAAGNTGSAGAAAAGGSSAPDQKPTPRQAQPTATAPRKATAQDVKAHIAQLAALGVAVPEEYRAEMAMPGEWQTVRQIPPAQIKKEGEGEEEDEKKGVAAAGLELNRGVRKRRMGDEEEEEAELARHVLSRKRNWGSVFRGVGDVEVGDEVDLDVLFPGKKVRVGGEGEGEVADVEAERVVKREEAVVKNEPVDDASLELEEHGEKHDMPVVKTEAEETKPEPEATTTTGVVFKKRKNKAGRPK
ncbi:hypothetical protein EJ05DRAFT_507439 [Pseudovirgaria hyperparasitica]|uniref:U1-C C2H2-type zinc finger domain-containing protein n=1 Tax=Pseudovirgaria hyperparasitica TaxID=470096 RepID=A0A6A6WI82_9PEZI|nr:uncharacterized protein EJ05DRAFT_507439 [Pseudovirgaria hyperparasitica]KAF2761815.1 hypothetical protein EJ05DRAFT_507439 [Pseudovirgaria hyperparasitica]